jgi:sulfur carrier protein
VTIEVNGEQVELPDDASLTDAVSATGADPTQRGIAVALDGEVVPKPRWGETMLTEGRRVEVVQAIQGG